MLPVVIVIEYYGLTIKFFDTETDALVQNCIHLVTAHQGLCGAEGLRSLPKIASEVEQHSKQLMHVISSNTDR